jgi:hypothetical protein
MPEDMDKTTSDSSPDNPDYLLQLAQSSALPILNTGSARVNAVTSSSTPSDPVDPEETIEDPFKDIDTSVLDNPVN